jgi:hypothetical protein
MATSRLVFSHAMTSAKDPGMREELAVGSHEAYCSFVSANARIVQMLGLDLFVERRCRG